MTSSPTKTEIIAIRKVIKLRIATIKSELTKAEGDLKKLQELCPHPDKHSLTDYDFTAYWCDDCDDHWSTR